MILAINLHRSSDASVSIDGAPASTQQIKYQQQPDRQTDNNICCCSRGCSQRYRTECAWACTWCTYLSNSATQRSFFTFRILWMHKTEMGSFLPAAPVPVWFRAQARLANLLASYEKHAAEIIVINMMEMIFGFQAKNIRLPTPFSINDTGPSFCCCRLFRIDVCIAWYQRQQHIHASAPGVFYYIQFILCARFVCVCTNVYHNEAHAISKIKGTATDRYK